MSGFRIIEEGPTEPIRNMAVDWAFLHLRGEDVIPDTLRIYSWRNRAVSVGYSQDVSRELDPERCRMSGTEVVFRPTGGALVLHQDDLTYSMVVGMPELNPSRWSDFSRRVGRALCEGLRGIGLQPVCAGGGEERGRRNRGACFSSLVRHEITVNGRKIIGNAKRWRRGALLQHGSIALRGSALSVIDLMTGLTDEERESKREELGRRSTTVEEETGRIVTCDELRPIMRSSFEGEFDRTFEDGRPGAKEESMINEFVDLVRRGPNHRKELRNARRLAAAGGNGR